MISTIRLSLNLSFSSLFFFCFEPSGLEVFSGPGMRVNACMVFGAGIQLPPSRKDRVESCLMREARAMHAR
jgi:hypothetical protein